MCAQYSRTRSSDGALGVERGCAATDGNRGAYGDDIELPPGTRLEVTDRRLGELANVARANREGDGDTPMRVAPSSRQSIGELVFYIDRASGVVKSRGW